MTTRLRSKRRAPNRKSQGLCRTNRKAVCFAIGDIEEYSSRSIIYTPELGIAGVLGALSSPISFAGLQLVGRFQKGTDVGRVLPVGDASVGEAAVRRTSASVRSRRARGRWRLRQSESSARRGTPGGPQR